MSNNETDKTKLQPFHFQKLRYNTPYGKYEIRLDQIYKIQWATKQATYEKFLYLCRKQFILKIGIAALANREGIAFETCIRKGNSETETTEKWWNHNSNFELEF